MSSHTVQLVGNPCIKNNSYYAKICEFTWDTGLGRHLWDKYGNIPVHLDEYRGSKCIQHRYVFLRQGPRKCCIYQYIDNIKYTQFPSSEWYIGLNNGEQEVLVPFQGYMLGDYDEEVGLLFGRKSRARLQHPTPSVPTRRRRGRPQIMRPDIEIPTENITESNRERIAIGSSQISALPVPNIAYDPFGPARFLANMAPSGDTRMETRPVVYEQGMKRSGGQDFSSRKRFRE